MSVLFSDSGVGTDENPLAGNWSTSGWNAMQRASNVFLSTGAPSMSYVNSVSPPNDQYCEITRAGAGGGGGIAPVVRYDGTNFYGMQIFGSTNVHLFHYGGGSYTAIATGSIAAIADGDEIRLSAVGTTITGYINGVQVIQTTDATVSSGSFGIWGWSGSQAISNVECGDFAASFQAAWARGVNEVLQ